MKKKICFICGQEKELINFYKHSGMTDGILGKCKECTKKQALQYRLENIEKVREYDRERSKYPHRKKQNAMNIIKMREKIPNMVSAHLKVKRAIDKGILIRPKVCSCCGKEKKTEAHHDNYKKPLEVIWLCRICHSNIRHTFK